MPNNWLGWKDSNLRMAGSKPGRDDPAQGEVVTGELVNGQSVESAEDGIGTPTATN